jgi:hypothetical protein
MELDKYFDRHTFYVSLKGATKEELVSFANRVIAAVQPHVGTGFNKAYRINYVLNKENKSVGLAYIYFASVEVYNMLNGKNPDGSERVEVTYLPTKPLTMEDYSADMSWAEAMEEEEKNIVRKQLPPLIQVDSSPAVIEPAFVLPPARMYAHNVLKCANLPPWLDKAWVKNVFSFYCSDTTKGKKKGKDGAKECYPIVTIVEKPDRISFVEFDGSTRDAQFALLMCKRMDVEVGRNRGTLYWQYSITYDK